MCCPRWAPIHGPCVPLEGREFRRWHPSVSTGLESLNGGPRYRLRYSSLRSSPAPAGNRLKRGVSAGDSSFSWRSSLLGKNRRPWYTGGHSDLNYLDARSVHGSYTGIIESADVLICCGSEVPLRPWTDGSSFWLLSRPMGPSAMLSSAFSPRLTHVQVPSSQLHLI